MAHPIGSPAHLRDQVLALKAAALGLVDQIRAAVDADFTTMSIHDLVEYAGLVQAFIGVFGEFLVAQGVKEGNDDK